MSIKEGTEYFRLQVIKWGKDLLNAQDCLVQTFEKTGDTHQLRKDFYNLRWGYLEKCLTAYAADLKGIQFASERDWVHLLQTKLGFYITRFAEDSQRLFPKQKLRNGYMVFRFAKVGNKLVSRLCEGAGPFIRV